MVVDMLLSRGVDRVLDGELAKDFVFLRCGFRLIVCVVILDFFGLLWLSNFCRFLKGDFWDLERWILSSFRCFDFFLFKIMISE